jgi:hypothetical protein
VRRGARNGRRRWPVRDHGEVYGQLKVDEKWAQFQRDLIAGLPGKVAKVESAIPEAIVNGILRLLAP